MKQKNKPGYTLVLALMIIALIVVIVSSLADRGSVHTHYLKTMIDRQKAKALAWSGVQIAMSQLAHLSDEPKSKEQDLVLDKNGKQKKSDAGKEKKQELLFLLPVLNKWQTFDLKKQNDGVTGQIKICLSSEEGKLNLNSLFDFKTKKFIGESSDKETGKAKQSGNQQKNVASKNSKGDAKKLLQEVFKKIKKAVGGKDLFGPFEKFLKARQTRLHDLTELLAIKEFELFKDKIFYEPGAPVHKDETGKLKQNIYLQDIFTLWSLQKELDPWMLSHSQKILFGLKKKDQLDEKNLQNILKNFSGEIQFPKGWDDMLAQVYGTKFDSLPKQMRDALGTKFEPTVLSVLSCGTVGGVTQKLLVILERKKSSRKDSSGKNVASFEFSAKKFYWL